MSPISHILATPAPTIEGRHRQPLALAPRPARQLTLRWRAALVSVIGLSLVGGGVGASTAMGSGPTTGTLRLTPGHAASAQIAGSLLGGTATASFSVPALPSAGGLWTAVQVRSSGVGDGVRVRARVTPVGGLMVGLSRAVGGRETVLTSRSVPGRVSPGSTVTVQAEVSGTSGQDVRARAWVQGQPQPAWQDHRTFSGMAPAASSAYVWSYLSGSARSAVTVGYTAVAGSSAPTGTVTPVPSGTASPTASRPPAPSSTTTRSPSSTTPPSSTPPPTTTSRPPSSSTTTSRPPTTTTTSRPPSSSTTTTPAPTATSTIAPAPFGGKPGPGNTGVPAGTRLTVYTGDLTITQAGTIIDGWDIHGFVVVEAANVTIRRSIVRGGVAKNDTGLVVNYNPAATNLVVEDSELVPSNPSVWIDGIKGANFTARRVNVHGTVDDVKVHGNNVLVTGSWLHGTQYYASDPNQGGGPSHNDGVQVLGGSNIKIIGNTVEQANNSALQVTQNYAPISNLVFSGNWANGGGCTVNLANSPRPTLSGITVNSNRFGRNTRIADCPILGTRATTFTADGNVWDDNGQPVRVRRNG
jgi:hypothetical protein